MPYSTSVFARFLRALHRSRRRQARREIRRHQHLIAQAREVPRPTIDPQTSGEPQLWTSTRTEADGLFGALLEWRRIFQADRYTQQPRS
jgi:hypothetical protein